MKHKIGIFNEFLNNHSSIIKACKDLNVNYEMIDLISTNWIDNIIKTNCNAFIYRPSNLLTHWKNMFEEKVYYVENALQKTVLPSFQELYFYENKKNLAYWLKINNIPHPKTFVFYDKDEALNFATTCNLPIVFKTNIGSSAQGVKIIRSRYRLKLLIKKCFPKFRIGTGGFVRWNTLKYKYKIPVSVPILSDVQKGYVIFQEYLENIEEWRVLRIGDSFFGHQKKKIGDFHSGSIQTKWIAPPEKLLNFVKDITNQFNFRSVACDIFEDSNENYFVNEIQCHVGVINPLKMKSQMYIDGKPGRYLFKNNQWLFEEGEFSQNNSNNLRVKYLLKLDKKG